MLLRSPALPLGVSAWPQRGHSTAAMMGAWPQGQCALDMSCSWLCLTVPAHNTLPASPAVHLQLTTFQMATSDDIVKIAVGVAAGELSLPSNGRVTCPVVWVVCWLTVASCA